MVGRRARSRGMTAGNHPTSRCVVWLYRVAGVTMTTAWADEGGTRCRSPWPSPVLSHRQRSSRSFSRFRRGFVPPGEWVPEPATDPESVSTWHDLHGRRPGFSGGRHHPVPVDDLGVDPRPLSQAHPAGRLTYSPKVDRARISCVIDTVFTESRDAASFANTRRRPSPWVAMIYADARDSGKDHAHAIRILARA
jgi:hypothetical protein